MIFNGDDDKPRQNKAISKFTESFSGSFKRLSPIDVDYRIYNKDGEIIAYAQVICVYDTISKSKQLEVLADKAVRVTNKMMNPIIIWAFDDGIAYIKLKNSEGRVYHKEGRLFISYPRDRVIY